MNGPRLRVFGGRVIRPLERIASAGEIIGLASRSTAYRLAEADDWPLAGPESSRWVLMIPLLEKYGIPYQTADIEGSDEHQQTSASSSDTESR